MKKVDFKIYNSNSEAEQARVLQAAQTTYSERFYILMKLIKVSSMIRNAKIVSSPVITDKPV